MTYPLTEPRPDVVRMLLEVVARAAFTTPAKDVFALTVTTQGRIELPPGTRDAWCWFHGRTAPVHLRFGGPDVVVDVSAVSTPSSDGRVAPTTNGAHLVIEAGERLPFRTPPGATHVAFDVDGETASLRFGRAEPGDSGTGRGWR